MDILLVVTAIILAYMVGSIPTGLILGRCQGIDIRLYGSGNIGATNTFRVLGRRWGIVCLVLDILKGYLPVWILVAEYFAPSGIQLDSWHWMIGLTAVSGHMFTPFLRFRGGKGVATSLGVLLAIVPVPFLIVLAIGMLIVWLSGYVSLASITCATLLPLLILIVDYKTKPWMSCIITSLLAGMIIYKHRTNIRRLLDGTECRIFDHESPVYPGRREDVQP